MGIVATPVASPKASNSSRVSSRSKRVSNTSHVSNRATTDAFSEDDDDLGMLSVSARASRSSQIAPENESELELLATDQTQLSEGAEAAEVSSTRPSASSKKASVSSRISSMLFGGSSSSKPPSTSSKIEEAVENASAETSSKRASTSSGRSTTQEYDMLVLRSRTVT